MRTEPKASIKKIITVSVDIDNYHDKCQICISFKFKGRFLLQNESCRNQTVNSGFKLLFMVRTRAGPNTIFLSLEASVVIITEYSKLRREGLNIFFSQIKAGISVRLSVCLHFYYVENRSSNDFTRGGCVAGPKGVQCAFWCNMDRRHVQN